LTRWLLDAATRLAFYRSYRDEGARAAMRDRGLDTSRDHVYPDLAFALTLPICDGPGDPQLVAVGIMAFRGTHDDRGRAEAIYSSYLTEMTRVVGWLIDNGREVHIIVGDTNGSDDSVVPEILARLRASRPNLDLSLVVPESARSFADVASVLLPVSSVVAIRYHNVLCALKLSKPTLSVSYAPKHDALMADMGVPEYCLPVGNLNEGQFIEMFTEMERESAQVREKLLERNAAKAQLLGDQFAELSAVLFPGSHQAHGAGTRSGS
jgi:polysaccharide pyruvyl transferase WcaK-like protein